MPHLILDDGGLPKPQYETEDGTAFEAQRGKEGAMFVAVKDGHNEALGKTGDPEAISGNGSAIGLLKALRTLLSNIFNRLGGGLPSTLSPSGGLRVSQMDPVSLAEGTQVEVSNLSNDVNIMNWPETYEISNLPDPLVTAALGSVQVGTSSIELKVGSDTPDARKALRVTNNSDVDISVGLSPSVTVSDGFILKPGATQEFPTSEGQQLYAIAGEDTGNTVSIVELV